MCRACAERVLCVREMGVQLPVADPARLAPGLVLLQAAKQAAALVASGGAEQLGLRPLPCRTTAMPHNSTCSLGGTGAHAGSGAREKLDTSLPPRAAAAGRSPAARRL